MSNNKKVKRVGRPKKPTIIGTEVNEVNQERLDMDKKENISIEEITAKWNKTFANLASIDGKVGSQTVAQQWNKLNPFLQNQRVKNLYTNPGSYEKADISKFLENPGNNERDLRSLGWANSSAQQIYYNIIRRSSSIPLYNYYKIPDLLDSEKDYDKTDFKKEDEYVDKWLDKFNIPNTFKTIALEVKREGKSSYLLRNKSVQNGNKKEPVFCTLQKMPTDWVKIVGKGELGFIISFNMMYFMDIANSPSDFGDFMVAAWEDMIEKGIVEIDSITKMKKFNTDKANNYVFEYKGNQYSSIIEIVKKGKQSNYFFWLKMPYDICYTFGSDNSHPWVAPDTMGLMLKLQELTDYGKLAGLIASTPLTAVLTGEIETISNPRAGKNESVYTPEVLKGWMQQFNSATSTNVEAWLWPAKNIKLQQLSSDVNSSDIITTATENFIESAGEGGLVITDSKPNVSQVKTAQLLAASEQNYVTLQFEHVMNFILKYKLGLKYTWKIRIWGDIFNRENDIKSLKEIVAGGNIALFPKLMSAHGINMRDTKAIVQYIENLDFYKKFKTYTQLMQAELAQESQEEEADEAEGIENNKTVGRPKKEESDIENDATAASRDSGLNTTDNRDV